MSTIRLEHEQLLAAAHHLAEGGAIAASPLRIRTNAAFTPTLSAAIEEYWTALSDLFASLSQSYFHEAGHVTELLGAYETLDADLAARMERLVHSFTQDSWRNPS
ncbi:MAG: hypothetical protein ACTIKL_05145 [Canibacter sp.]